MAPAMRCVTMTVMVLLVLVVAEICAKPLAEGQVTAEKSVAITNKYSAIAPNDVADARSSSLTDDQVGVESNLSVSEKIYIQNGIVYLEFVTKSSRELI